MARVGAMVVKQQMMELQVSRKCSRRSIESRVGAVRGPFLRSCRPGSSGASAMRRRYFKNKLHRHPQDPRVPFILPPAKSGCPARASPRICDSHMNGISEGREQPVSRLGRRKVNKHFAFRGPLQGWPAVCSSMDIGLSANLAETPHQRGLAGRLSLKHFEKVGGVC